MSSGRGFISAHNYARAHYMYNVKFTFHTIRLHALFTGQCWYFLAGSKLQKKEKYTKSIKHNNHDTIIYYKLTSIERESLRPNCLGAQQDHHSIARLELQ